MKQKIKKYSAVMIMSFVAIFFGALHFFVASAAVRTSVTVRYPEPAISQGIVRELEQRQTTPAFSNGLVQIGPNAPTVRPTPSESQPFPRFSGVDSSVWVSESGRAQIFDDTIFWGLTEIKNGMKSNVPFDGASFNEGARNGAGNGGANNDVINGGAR